MSPQGVRGLWELPPLPQEGARSQAAPHTNWPQPHLLPNHRPPMQQCIWGEVQSRSPSGTTLPASPQPCFSAGETQRPCRPWTRPASGRGAAVNLAALLAPGRAGASPGSAPLPTSSSDRCRASRPTCWTAPWKAPGSGMVVGTTGRGCQLAEALLHSLHPMVHMEDTSAGPGDWCVGCCCLSPALPHSPAGKVGFAAD